MKKQKQKPAKQKDQNLKILFEDIASHRREVKEIEALTFQQLMGVQKRIAAELRKKGKVMADESEDDSPEEE
ncbi:hypothetical protein HY491_02120 [Candidatus Woesearchaeota archaeon]|nr:hypothetical protein [Candidatus Woesearchaeota archaeon]